MTEQSFQEARKLMQKANCIRGLITTAKGEVAKWTKIEDVHRQEFREAQADGARKCLHGALKKLDALRDKFAQLKFPDSDLQREVGTACCQECKGPVAKEDKECGDCASIGEVNY